MRGAQGSWHESCYACACALRKSRPRPGLVARGLPMQGTCQKPNQNHAFHAGSLCSSVGRHGARGVVGCVIVHRRSRHVPLFPRPARASRVFSPERTAGVPPGGLHVPAVPVLWPPQANASGGMRQTLEPQLEVERILFLLLVSRGERVPSGIPGIGTFVGLYGSPLWV